MLAVRFSTASSCSGLLMHISGLTAARRLSACKTNLHQQSAAATAIKGASISFQMARIKVL